MGDNKACERCRAAERAVARNELIVPAILGTKTANALRLVLAERAKQLRQGWDREHDAQFHNSGELAAFSASYLLSSAVVPRNAVSGWMTSTIRAIMQHFNLDWPNALKPRSQREDLVRGIAIAIAELERVIDAEVKEAYNLPSQELFDEAMRRIHGETSHGQ